MSRRYETNPLDRDTNDTLTFDDWTLLAFVCVTSLCAVVLFALGLWTAGQDLCWVFHP